MRIAGYVCLVLSASIYSLTSAIYWSSEPMVTLPGDAMIQDALDSIPRALNLYMAIIALLLSFITGVLGTRLLPSILFYSVSSFLISALILFGFNQEFFGQPSFIGVLELSFLNLLPLVVYLFGYLIQFLYRAIRQRFQC